MRLLNVYNLQALIEVPLFHKKGHFYHNIDKINIFFCYKPLWSLIFTHLEHFLTILRISNILTSYNAAKEGHKSCSNHTKSKREMVNANSPNYKLYTIINVINFIIKRNILQIKLQLEIYRKKNSIKITKHNFRIHHRGSTSY